MACVAVPFSVLEFFHFLLRFPYPSRSSTLVAHAHQGPYSLGCRNFVTALQTALILFSSCSRVGLVSD
jgi:hypothetical protein